jgi:hypothetical protein
VQRYNNRGPTTKELRLGIVAIRLESIYLLMSSRDSSAMASIVALPAVWLKPYIRECSVAATALVCCDLVAGDPRGLQGLQGKSHE